MVRNFLFLFFIFLGSFDDWCFVLEFNSSCSMPLMVNKIADVVMFCMHEISCDDRIVIQLLIHVSITI